LRNNAALMTARVRSAALLTFAWIALSALGASRARAEDVTAAREHYKKGTTYYDLGKYADAAKEFEAAYEAKNDPAFLYNLAQSYRLAGDPDQALHFYKTYLRYVPKPPNRAEIEEQIKMLEQKVAAKNPTAPPPAGTSPPPAATAPPPPPPTETPTAPPPPVTPGPGGPAVVTTAPPSPPIASDVTPPPPPVATTPDPGRTYRIAGVATAGAGAVMILVGFAEGARAHSAATQIEHDASMGKAFDPAVESRGKSAEKAQWWLLGLGVAAGATGGALWYYGTHLTAEARAAGTVSFAPVVGPGHGGALMRVTF
jgi:tetratricopeptide (TPR) repeat protein